MGGVGGGRGLALLGDDVASMGGGRRMTLPTWTPHRRLVAAILKQAVKDIRARNDHAFQARTWLLESESADLFFEAIGLNRRQAEVWLDQLGRGVKIAGGNN
jgi:hypothetical protein